MPEATATGPKTAAEIESIKSRLGKRTPAYNRGLIPIKRNIRIYSVNDEPVIRNAGVQGFYLIQPRPTSERYGPPLLIRDPFLEDSFTGDYRGELRFDDGLEYAMDIVHGGKSGVDNDLRFQGVFIPNADPAGDPSESDLKTAEDMLRANYLRWLQAGDDLASKGKVAEITPLSHKAVDKLHIQREWHDITDRYKTCPQCGEHAPETAIKHSCGYIFDWDAALVKKIVTKKQFDSFHEVEKE